MSDNDRDAELIAGQARLEGGIDTLAARLEAHLDTNNRVTNALFMAQREHAAKIEDIRVDYVPKADFKAHKEQNREDHKTVIEAISGVQWKVAKIAGGITLLAFLAGWVVKAIRIFGQ